MSKQADPSSLYIGIDLGTSGCRAIAINISGTIKAQASFDYPNPKQQSPQNWWSATQDVLQKLFSQINSQNIKAIAVDGTSSTVLLCDDSGEPLTPALMYDDQRAIQQAQFLKQFAPKDSIVLNPTSSLAKVLWLFENHPPKKEFQIVHQADWITGQFCQQFNVSDVNNVLKMGFDVINKQWPSWLLKLLKKLNIKEKSLPKVLTPGDVISKIAPHIAKDFDLPLDVEIIAGTTDSTAAFIASGANTVGQAVTSLGSTLVIKIISDTPIEDPHHGVYSQAYNKHWLVGGASNSGGAVLRHYFTDPKMQDMSKDLKPSIPTNLNYYPLINKGERFPINDANLQPYITPKAESDVLLFQGLLEGIAEIEHTGYKLLKKLGAPYPKTVQTNGGGAINKAWQQIREDKLGIPVSVAKHTAAAMGQQNLRHKLI